MIAWRITPIVDYLPIIIDRLDGRILLTTGAIWALKTPDGRIYDRNGAEHASLESWREAALQQKAILEKSKSEGAAVIPGKAPASFLKLP